MKKDECSAFVSVLRRAVSVLFEKELVDWCQRQGVFSDGLPVMLPVSNGCCFGTKQGHPQRKKLWKLGHQKISSPGNRLVVTLTYVWPTNGG